MLISIYLICPLALTNYEVLNCTNSERFAFSGIYFYLSTEMKNRKVWSHNFKYNLDHHFDFEWKMQLIRLI